MNVLGACDGEYAFRSELSIDVDYRKYEFELRYVLEQYNFELIQLLKMNTLEPMPLLTRARIRYTKPLSMHLLEDLKELYRECRIYGIHLNELSE